MNPAIKARAEAIRWIATRRAWSRGLAWQPCVEVGNYGASMVLAGHSGARALQLTDDQVLAKCDQYARVRVGDSNWRIWSIRHDY